MELRQLRYLVDVVEEGSFTKAAQNAYVAQPGVSAQIRALERELGHTLLDRSGRTVTPTQMGAAVLPHARAALRAIAQIGETVEAMTGLLTGHLTIGTVPSISTDRINLPGLLAGFHHAHPGVDISLTEASSTTLLDSLRDGSLEVALISQGTDATPRGVSTHTLATEPVVVGVGPDHALAGRKHVVLNDLATHALVTLPPGTGTRSRLDDAARKAGAVLQIAFEAGDPKLLVQLASEGLGVVVLPRSQLASAHESGTLNMMSLRNPSLAGHIALAWHSERDLSPTVDAFLAHARCHGQ